jgi:hypothetical protein
MDYLVNRSDLMGGQQAQLSSTASGPPRAGRRDGDCNRGHDARRGDRRAMGARTRLGRAQRGPSRQADRRRVSAGTCSAGPDILERVGLRRAQDGHGEPAHLARAAAAPSLSSWSSAYTVAGAVTARSRPRFSGPRRGVDSIEAYGSPNGCTLLPCARIPKSGGTPAAGSSPPHGASGIDPDLAVQIRVDASEVTGARGAR